MDSTLQTGSMSWEYLRRVYRSSSFGRLVLGPGRAMYYLYRFRMIPERWFIQKRFKEVFGRKLDLANPRTFNEKIQWLKLNDRTPLHTQCADKYAVRQYVAEKVGAEYLVPLLCHTENAAEIRPENLPEVPFVIKTTHLSGGVTLVRDKAAINWKVIRRLLREQLGTNAYYLTKEWQYRNIKPRIVVEQLIRSKEGIVPTDYKIYCFHGRPSFVQVIAGRYVETRECFYSTDWRALDFKLTYPLIQSRVDRPERLGEMLSVAAALSSDFCYARIDLYSEFGRVYFGEITHHPDSGFGNFDPPEWDRKLGDMLVLPNSPTTVEGGK